VKRENVLLTQAFPEYVVLNSSEAGNSADVLGGDEGLALLSPAMMNKLLSLLEDLEDVVQAKVKAGPALQALLKRADEDLLLQRAKMSADVP